MAPHEAGQVWRRWFPTSADVENRAPVDALCQEARHELRQTIAAMSDAFGAPFINKNVFHSIRIRVLSEVFRDALFVWMRRDPLDAAASILQARRDTGVPSDGWWSVAPRQVDRLRELPIAEQVAGQIYYLERNIAQDLDTLDRERSLTLDYSEVCRRPRVCLARIAEFVQSHRGIVRVRGEIPDRFEPSQTATRLDEADRIALETAFDRHRQEAAILASPLKDPR
jgi:hypothetical protein